MVTRVRRRGAVEAGGAAAAQPWQTWAAGLLGQHWLVCVLLAAGLVLRVLAQIAYRPPLIYVDTLKYLYGLYPGSEPLAYHYLLKIILFAGDLGTVALLQHLLGLAMGIALYAVLTRRGTPCWLAAIAAAPVLLDAYQLQMEQMIMPDVWFEAMIVAGLVVLLWRPVPPVRFLVTAGLILGLAATFKQLGELLILPALCYLLAAAGGWRPLLRSGTALVAAFALPVACYCGWSYLQNRHFRLAASQSLTGRLMGAADCAALTLPAAARPLCPTPAQQAIGPDNLQHSVRSPLHQGTMPPATRRRLIADLDNAVEHQQPGRVLLAIAHDWARIFISARAPSAWATPISRWQFQTHYPTAGNWVKVGTGGVITVGLQPSFGPFHFVRLPAAYGGPAHVDRPAAAFLRTYQLGGGYTPGWLLAVFALAGLAGSVLAARRGSAVIRRTVPAVRELATGCVAFTATAAAVLLAPIAVEFSWRYELLAVVTLPPAGVLGGAALLTVFRQARHVPRGSCRPGSRRLHAGHHLASQRTPARLIPGRTRTSRF